MPSVEYYEPELAYLEKILRGKSFHRRRSDFGVYTLVASRLVGETGRVLLLRADSSVVCNIAAEHRTKPFSNVRAF